MADDYPASQGEDKLESREPTSEDLVALARSLNSLDARYIVIGGFAIRAAGYDRRTMDIDLLIDNLFIHIFHKSCSCVHKMKRFAHDGRNKLFDGRRA